MWPLPNGDVLEKGSDAEGDYEELWKDLDIESRDGKRTCWVLQLDKEDDKGMIVGIGTYVAGVRRGEDGMAVVRYLWAEVIVFSFPLI